MSPDKKKIINNQVIEQYYWHGKYVVYIDSKLTHLNFSEACIYVEKLSSTLIPGDK
jgi:hypothetical protein